MRWAVVAGALCAGCLGSRTTPCSSGSDSWICPANELCAAPPVYCGSSTLVDACKDKQQFDPCMLTDMNAGACVGGVCTMCSVDLEGCHYDGWTAMDSQTTADLRSLWVGKPGEALAAGKGGALVRYDGATWSSQPFPAIAATASVIALSGSARDDVFALVENGQVFHYDGVTWTEITPTNATFSSDLWSPAPGHAIVVTPTGAVLTYDGSGWMTVNVGVLLNGVSGTSATDVFAVGNTGTIEHFDGTWTAQTSATSQNLNAVWSTGGTAVAVGAHSPTSSNPTIELLDGTWSAVMTSAVPGSDLLTVWGTSATDVYLGGANGVIAHFDGSGWSSTVHGPISIYSVRGRSGELYAVGGGGTILRLTP